MHITADELRMNPNVESVDRIRLISIGYGIRIQGFVEAKAEDDNPLFFEQRNAIYLD